MTEIIVYTDGSCLKNPDGPSGWAFLIKYDNENSLVCSGYEKSSTNNRMEITAVIEAVKFLNKYSNRKITIKTDSMLVINCMTGKWGRKTNTDLWFELDKLSKGLDIKWVWVKGHSGIEENELVDKHARDEAIHAKSLL